VGVVGLPNAGDKPTLTFCTIATNALVPLSFMVDNVDVDGDGDGHGVQILAWSLVVNAFEVCSKCLSSSSGTKSSTNNTNSTNS